MQDQYIQALAILQASKQRGLSYFEAIQSLKSQGFNQQTIEDVSDRYDYQHGIIRSPNSRTHGITPEEHEAEEQKLHDELEDVDAQERKDHADQALEDFHFGL